MSFGEGSSQCTIEITATQKKSMAISISIAAVRYVNRQGHLSAVVTSND